ncbi:wolframin [Chrysoperla carnea]|uniref:wolframin n=1 Tax=Chrysoperla carnea TaxID=189513 RepID=UPI001D06EA2F|nr:wolframin [Chrysoperla carnea]
MAVSSNSTSPVKTRKQWTLHDGPRGSLQRLRNQLAEDGCPESQVILAKQLLNEQCELDVDRAENARIAVYWLIKSSEQGNKEATELLIQCYKTCIGINEHNYIDVNRCINMPLNEKLCRKAARDLFISLSNGEEFITTNQLKNRILELYRNQKDKTTASTSTSNRFRQIEWPTKIEKNNKKLTEENLIRAAIQYSNGDLPDINHSLSLYQLTTINNNNNNTDGEDASDQIEPEQLKTMISYSKYMNECGYHKQIDPNEESLVSKQIKCLEYDGEEILWNGSIELIKK